MTYIQRKEIETAIIYGEQQLCAQLLASVSCIIERMYLSFIYEEEGSGKNVNNILNRELEMKQNKWHFYLLFKTTEFNPWTRRWLQNLHVGSFQTAQSTIHFTFIKYSGIMIQAIINFDWHIASFEIINLLNIRIKELYNIYTAPLASVF